MLTFSPDVHTPHALAEEIDFVYQTFPDALLVGSLGRGGVYSDLFGDAEHEYRSRSQKPVQNFQGYAADLDMINAPASLEGDLSPFSGDLKSFCGRQVTLAVVDGSWVLGSENRGFWAEVDERVMEPKVTTTVYGAPCRTLSPQTHLKLLGVAGTIRDKDEIARDILGITLSEKRVATLPANLYEPFDELTELNYQSTLATARRAYRAVVPMSLRKRLAPSMQKVKDHYLR